MKKLVSIFIRFPFYANIILFIILGVGLMSFFSMNRSFFPDFSEKFINISVFYPGASPKEMEEGITIRVEEALRGIAGIKEVTSTSFENFSSVRVEITGEYDIDETLMEVKNAVDGITSFPVDAERPIVNKERSTSFGAFMGLSGDVDLLTLKEYANEIEYDLYNSGIMSQIRISGFPDLEISVEVSEENLRRYNLNFDEISRAIAFNNQDISGGQIRSDKEEIMIRSRYRTGKAVSAGAYNGEELNWDIRASDAQWQKWISKPPGMMGLGTAFASGKMKFIVGDYGSMLKDPRMAKPFIKSFSVMARV